MERLKHKNENTSTFKNMSLQSGTSSGFCQAPGTTYKELRGNEADRLTRCRHCGFICDKERHVRLKDGSYAGFGIQQGALLTAGTTKYDKRVPAAGVVATSADTYYSRTVNSGCPCCGSFLYDPKMPIIQIP